MKREYLAALASGLALSLLCAAAAANQWIGDYGRLPLAFEANAGQTDGRVQFLSRGSGYTLFLTANEAVLHFPNSAGRVLRMKLAGARVNATASGADELPGKSNYFIGNDPDQWRTNVPNYARVKYLGVYPGVDLIYYGNQSGQLEYDFVVAPGTDPSGIGLDIAEDGVRPAKDGRRARLRIAADGDLLVKVGDGEVRLHKPLVYQREDGVRPNSRKRIVEGAHFVLTAANQVRFAFGHYDRRRALIIDPALVYSTYLGGNAIDQGFGIAVDAAGSAYVTGYAGSLDFPTANAFQPSDRGGGGDAFVTKFNAAGTALVYSTFLGGSGADLGNGIAVDSAGSAYVTGSTLSTDFPLMNPLQASNGFQNPAAFVTKLSPDGSALIYSTYLGGGTNCFGDQQGNAIAVDAAGNAYVAGVTGCADFPTVNPLQAVNKTSSPNIGTGFVAKYNAAGSALIYATYLGGSVEDIAHGIAADSAGNAYITGQTTSTDFPTANPFQSTCNHCPAAVNAFVTKIDATGSAFIYSTFLGGSDTNIGNAIAADASGNAYVTGNTTSTNFPTVNPLQATNHGGSNVFVTKFNAAGTGLVYSTYLGGSGGADDTGRGIAVDSAGKAYVAGSTGSFDFPVVNAIQPTNHSGPGSSLQNTGFVSNFNAAGSALIYSTYLGGDLGDRVQAIALDSSDHAYVTGYTFSLDFPTVNPFQPANNAANGEGINAFVSKLPAGAASSSAPTVSLSVTPTTITAGERATLAWSSTNASSCTASGAWTGTQATSGTQSVSPTQGGSSTYILTCTGAGGSAQASAELTVKAALPAVTLAVKPASITVGESATLTWSSTNATSCTASGAWSGAQATSGTHTESPVQSGSDTYTLTCSDAGGSAQASAQLTVNAAPPPAPTVTLSVDPTAIALGESATLTWSSTNATSCAASGAWSGTQKTSGALKVTPGAAGTSVYMLSCSGADSGTSDTSVVKLTVNARIAAVTELSGKAGGGGMGLWSLLGLGLLVGWRMRRAPRPADVWVLGIIGLAAALAAAAPASAQDSSAPAQFNWNQTYVGIRVGAGSYWESSRQLDADLAANGETGTTTSIDQHRTSGVVYAGVPFYRALSLELGFADLGTYPVGISTTSTNISQLAQTIVRNLSPAGRALTLNLAAPLDINPWFALEPRIGVFGYRSKQEVFTPIGTFSHDREGAGIDGGLVLLLRPTRSIYIGAGIDCFETDGRCNVLLYSAEIEYHFGR